LIPHHSGEDITVHITDGGIHPKPNILILFFFSLLHPSSLGKLYHQWVSKLSHQYRETTRILVGTGSDLQNQQSLPSWQAKQLQWAIGARAYFECAAGSLIHTARLFKMAARYAFGTPETQKVKILCVGDEVACTTALLYSYATKAPIDEFVPTVFDNFVGKLTIDDRKIILQLWDTRGQNDLDNIRVGSYEMTDVFVVCFSLVDPPSLESVQRRWNS
jgi:GTPase SAR1 family protein